MKTPKRHPATKTNSSNTLREHPRVPLIQRKHVPGISLAQVSQRQQCSRLQGCQGVSHAVCLKGALVQNLEAFLRGFDERGHLLSPLLQAEHLLRRSCVAARTRGGLVLEIVSEASIHRNIVQLSNCDISYRTRLPSTPWRLSVFHADTEQNVSTYDIECRNRIAVSI